MPEGGSREYQVWMTEPPTEPVTVNRQFTGSDSDLTSSSNASHTFNEDNWFEPYRVEIAAASDADVFDGMRTIQHTVVTSDPFYENQSPRFVLVSEDDSESDANGSKTRSRDTSISSGLTAAVFHLPERHNGQRFFMYMQFSQPLKTGFANMRDYAWELDNARVLRAFRIHGDSSRWGFIVEPRSNENITMTMEGARPCSEQGAVCASGGTRLKNSIFIGLAGSSGDAQLPPGADNSKPVISMQAPDAQESNSLTVIAIQLSRTVSHTVSVDIGMYSITAQDPDDYIWQPYHTVTISPGLSSVGFNIEIIDDDIAEDTETFGVFITNPVGGVFDLQQNQQQTLHQEITIIDDD